MDLIQTVDESFCFFEKIGMQVQKSDCKARYAYPEAQTEAEIESSAEILGNTDLYYFMNLDYHIEREILQRYRMTENYIEIGEIQTVQPGPLLQDNFEAGMEVRFGVVRTTGAIGCIYCRRFTYYKGSSLILRDAFCRNHLFPVVHEIFGMEVDEYSIIQMAGNNCQPRWTNLIRELSNNPYSGRAAQLFLDAKATEVVAALTDAFERMSALEIQRFGSVEQLILKKAQAILHERLMNPPSTKVLSQMLDVSPNLLQAIFKYFTGVTAMEYLRSYRLERAQELLQSGNTVEEVAQSIGYNNINRFSEAFYRSYGIKPAKYQSLSML